MFHLNAESTEGSCMEHEELCTAELTYAAGNAQLVTYSYLSKAEPVVGTIATAMPSCNVNFFVKCFSSLWNTWAETSRECKGGIHLTQLDIPTSVVSGERFIWLKVDACFKMSWLTFWTILTVLTRSPLTMTPGLSAASTHSKTGEKFNEFDWRLGTWSSKLVVNIDYLPVLSLEELLMILQRYHNGRNYTEIMYPPKKKKERKGRKELLLLLLLLKISSIVLYFSNNVII